MSPRRVDRLLNGLRIDRRGRQRLTMRLSVSRSMASPSLVSGPALPLIVGATGMIATGVAHLATPGRSLLLPCPLYTTTGIHCPGCGATRALHALTHGDLADALHNNVMFVTLLPFAVYAWFAWLMRSRGRSTALPIPMFSARTGWCIAVLTIAFFVLRNVPAFGWLAPIPV